MRKLRLIISSQPWVITCILVEWIIVLVWVLLGHGRIRLTCKTTARVHILKLVVVLKLFTLEITRLKDIFLELLVFVTTSSSTSVVMSIYGRMFFFLFVDVTTVAFWSIFGYLKTVSKRRTRTRLKGEVRVIVFILRLRRVWRAESLVGAWGRRFRGFSRISRSIGQVAHYSVRL